MSKAAELAALIANVNKGSSLANKNFIINGAMNVAQRGTSSTGISSSNYYTVDRFKCTIENTAGRLTMEQVADGPDGFANCTKLTCTTADTSIASNEALILHQNIEGQNVQSLKKGTSDAVPVTVSFYVKANASATYTLELRSGDGGTNRMNSQEFSVTTGWTRVELTFVGDTSQVLDDDNEASLLCNIWLHGGSDYTGGSHTDNAWHTTNNQRVGDNQTSFFDSTSRTFFITGWQLEIGEKATEFEHEPYERTLKKCQRYLETYIVSGTCAVGNSYATNQFIIPFFWSVTKRDTPTFTFPTVGTASGNLGVTTNSGAYPSSHGSVMRSINHTNNWARLYNNSGDGYAGFTDDHLCTLYGNGTPVIKIESEL